MARKALKKAIEPTEPASVPASAAPEASTGPLLLSTTRKELLAVLRKVAATCPKGKRSMPILQHVAITTGPHGAIFAATDLNTYAVVHVTSWQTSGASTLLVPAKALVDLVVKLPEGPITVRETSERGRAVEIASALGSIGLAALHGRDFPKLPPVLPDDPAAGQALTTVDADKFRALLEATDYAVCQDETRFHLNGVLFEYDGGTARAIATDGHRLALAQVELERAGDFKTADKGVIIPEDVVTAFRKLAKGSGTVDVGMVSMLDAGMLAMRRSVQGMTTTIVSKLIDAQFPPYWQVIPHDNLKLCTVNRQALISAMERAKTLCTSTRGAKLTVRSGVLTVFADQPDTGGEIRETLEAETRPDGLDFAIGVNPRYLADALQALEGDRVTIALGKNELDPILVRSTEDATTRMVRASSRLAVIMPMRI